MKGFIKQGRGRGRVLKKKSESQAPSQDMTKFYFCLVRFINDEHRPEIISVPVFPRCPSLRCKLDI